MCIYIGSGLNENSFFIVKVRTDESRLFSSAQGKTNIHLNLSVCVCVWLWSNANSSFIVNVRTAESASYGIVSLNIHVLFRLNNIASMLFSLNNTWCNNPKSYFGLVLLKLRIWVGPMYLRRNVLLFLPF